MHNEPIDEFVSSTLAYTCILGKSSKTCRHDNSDSATNYNLGYLLVGKLPWHIRVSKINVVTKTLLNHLDNNQ